MFYCNNRLIQDRTAMMTRTTLNNARCFVSAVSFFSFFSYSFDTNLCFIVNTVLFYLLQQGEGNEEGPNLSDFLVQVGQ